MLPDFLSSSYRQYKDDTSAFTTWLGRAAEACGYKPKTQAKKVSETVGGQTALLPTPPAGVPYSQAPQAPAAPATSQRLKGTARKLAKQAQTSAPASTAAEPPAPESVKTVKYNLSTKELIAQIDAVHQAKRMWMPSGITTLLDRAIKARQRCSEWYEKLGAGHRGAVFDNGGHRHFIDLLQDAMAKLGSKEEWKEASSAVRQPSSKDKKTIELQ